MTTEAPTLRRARARAGEWRARSSPRRRGPGAASERTGGARTVPQIFIDGEFLPGGCDGLFERERNGELNAVLGIK